MDKACRLCLIESDEMYGVYEYQEERIISDMIYEILQIKISSNDSLSKLICQDCLNIISSAINLKKISIQNEKIQRSMSTNLSIKQEEELYVSPINIDSILISDVKKEDNERELIQKFNLRPLSISISKIVEQYEEDPNDGDKYSDCNESSNEEDAVMATYTWRVQKSMMEKESRRTCKYCGRIFARRDSMLGHLKKRHKVLGGFFKCDLCNRNSNGFKLRARLEEHMMIYHLKTIKKSRERFKYYECEECELSYIHLSDLQSHCLYDHGKVIDKPKNSKLKCKFCRNNVQFKNLTDLNYHFRNVHCDKKTQIRAPPQNKELPKKEEFAVKKYFKENCQTSTYAYKVRKSALESEERRTCHTCFKVFTRRDTMLAHLRTAHNLYGGFYRCDLCDQAGETKTFKLRARLEEHILHTHLRTLDQLTENHFTCYDCKDTFLFFNDLQVHSLHVHEKDLEKPPGKFLTCKYCSQKFKSRHAITVHYDKDHADLRKKLQCNLCQETFFMEHRLNDHIRKNHTLDLNCKICKFKTKTRQELNLHGYMHCDLVGLYQGEIKFECILCSFSCTDDNELYNHLPAHVDDFTEEKLIVCINCSTVINTFEDLHTHTGVHNERLTHVCLKCNKKFGMNNKFLRHLKKHKDNEKHTCPYEDCGMAFRIPSTLKEHIDLRHAKKVLHLCQICGESFASRGSLRNHVNHVHEDKNRSFKCNLCPMAFRNAAHLRNHFPVHSNEYTFPCDVPGCTKVFKAKRNLLRHKTFHDRSKLNLKHVCEFEGCGKRFLTLYALKRHTFTHTKLKPFECTYCDRSFSQSNDLNKHLRSHLGSENTYFCKHCNESFRLKGDLRIHEAIHYLETTKSTAQIKTE